MASSELKQCSAQEAGPGTKLRNRTAIDETQWAPSACSTSQQLHEAWQRLAAGDDQDQQ